MLTSSTRLRPNESEVAAKVMDGEAIIINLSNGMYYSMDRAGGLIWALIAEGRTLEEITAGVARSYDVAPERARADLERLAAELLAENLVLVADGAAPPAAGGLPEQRSGLPYEAPRLNKYHDMADLLALDPPMPELKAIGLQEPHGPASR